MNFESETLKVIDAIKTLYFCEEPNQKKAASKWLQSFQATVNAWKIADMILCDMNSASEFQFFAAQTIRKKIVSDLGQIPQESIQSLRTSLTTHLCSHKNANKALQTQLILSIADLALQMTDWEDPIADMERILVSSEDSLALFLEFLKVLPEECVNSRIPMEISVLEAQTKRLVDLKVSSVLDSIISFFQAKGLNGSWSVSLVLCLQSWMRYARFEDPSYLNSRMILVSLLFQAIQVPTLFDEAVEALCDLFVVSQDYKLYYNVIKEVYGGLLSLRTTLNSLIEEENDLEMRSFCRLFVEAGESYLEILIQDPASLSFILEAILACYCYKSLEISQLTFHFWWSFADRLTTDGDSGANWKDQKFICEIFTKLVSETVKHLQYPSDLDSWNAQEKEDFRSFRHEIGDCLKCCCKVIGESTVLSLILDRLNFYVKSGNSKWQEIEACLFAFRASGANVSVQESQVLPQLMLMIQTLPPHPKIKYAVILVFSRYAEWTRYHLEFLQFQFEYIMKGFEDSETRAASALALKFICQHCAEHMIGCLEVIFNLLCGSLRAFHSIDVLEIIEAACYLLSKAPMEVAFAACPRFLDLVALELESPVQYNNQDELISNIIVQLDRIGSFMRYLSINNNYPFEAHPLVIFMEKHWETFERISLDFGLLDPVSESLCKCFINCIRNVNRYYVPVFQATLKLLTIGFQKHLASAYLYATQCCIKYFMVNADLLLLCVKAISDHTDSMAVKFNSVDNFNELPDVVTDYFYLMDTYVTNYSNTLNNFDILIKSFELAILGLECRDEKALKHVLKYLSSLVRFQRDNGVAIPLKMFVKERLPVLVSKILFGCLKRFRGECLDVSTRIFFDLAGNFGEDFARFVSLSIEDLPQDRFSGNEKQSYVEKILSSCRKSEPILKAQLSTLAAIGRRRFAS